MADYTGVNKAERTWDSGRNHTKYVKIDTSQSDSDKTPVQVVAERVHPTLQKRGKQIQINLLGQKAGKPYVDARLSRFAGEDSISWAGGTRAGGGCVTGRKDQAHSVPYLTRISEKINQYVLGVTPEREGISDEIAADITASGQTINQFMAEGNNYLTAAGWYWIKVDAPYVDEEISQAEAEERKIRPYWQNYSPLQVVDWYINDKGIVEWTLTEEYDYIAFDPTVQGQMEKFRRLWQPGKMTEYHFEKEDGEWTGKVDWVKEYDTTLTGVVNFIQVGTISAEPHGFDTLESITRTIMDLESCNRQNYFNCVFPQKYFPASMMKSIKNSSRSQNETSVTMNIGYDYPIFLGQNDPAPGLLMPDAASTKSMREELQALKHNLFDAVGLMLQQESKQVASAEAKAWDFLDVKQVMKERSMILEDAERKAIELSRQWDGNFPEWQPNYNKMFDVSDPEKDMKTIVLTQQMELPPTMQKIQQRKTLEVLERIGNGEIPEEERLQALEEIAAFQPQVFELLPEPTEE